MLSQTWNTTRTNIEGRCALYDFLQRTSNSKMFFGHLINIEERILLYVLCSTKEVGVFFFYELTVYVLFLNERYFGLVCSDITFFTGQWFFTVAWLLKFASGNIPKMLLNRMGGRVSVPYPSIHPSNKTPIQLTIQTSIIKPAWLLTNSVLVKFTRFCSTRWHHTEPGNRYEMPHGKIEHRRP